MSGRHDSAPQDLQDVQVKFKQYLMQSQTAIAEHIVSTSDLTNDIRLAIYGNAYVSRLIEVLQKDYTALLAILGEEQFNQLAREYIDVYPSMHPSLRFFGKHMESFLYNQKKYASHPYLYELARFEWGFTDAFDARDSEIKTEHDAALVPPDAWPGLGFSFHASLQLIPYQWNILSIWQAIQQEKSIPEPIHLPEPEICLIWRHNLQTQYRTLEEDEKELLPAAMQGANFSDLCVILTEQNDIAEQVPMRAASLLKSWLAAGLIKDFIYPE